MTPLLSAAQMAAIQTVGESGMTADVEIFHESIDLGLDLTDDEYGSKATIEEVSSTAVKGWLVGRWSDTRNQNGGDIDTTGVYRLRLPVGTEIAPGDRVDISSNSYSVIDVGNDQTWQEWLTCVLRRSK
jgi:hypothetical protein